MRLQTSQGSENIFLFHLVMELHNSIFPGHVTGNMFEYRGIGIFREGGRFRIDFALGNRFVSSLEWAKKVIDSELKKYC